MTLRDAIMQMQMELYGISKEESNKRLSFAYSACGLPVNASRAELPKGKERVFIEELKAIVSDPKNVLKIAQYLSIIVHNN